MRAKIVLRTIETHTEGHPCRHVVSGFPIVPGNTMMEKHLYMKEHNDWLRKLVCYEPRGTEYLSGSLITQPCTPGTDIGILHFESSTWLPMCGGNTFGATVAMIETGMIPVTEPITRIKIDNASGVVEVAAKVKDGVVTDISFLNAPALVMLRDAKVQTEEWGEIVLDIAWGGNVYAILPAEKVGLEIKPENGSKFIATARKLKKYIDDQLEFHHPEFEFINEVTHVEFYGPPKNPQADIQNCTIALPSVIDRCPCGTGTSAKAAVLYDKGIKKIGESFVHESIIGTLFKCELTEACEVNGVKAVKPTISGKAYIMGYSTLILDPRDPFPEGFLLG
jgi:proline racemase